MVTSNPITEECCDSDHQGQGEQEGKLRINGVQPVPQFARSMNNIHCEPILLSTRHLRLDIAYLFEVKQPSGASRQA